MNQQSLTRAAIIGLFLLAVLYTVFNFNEWEVATQIVTICGLGVVGGIVFVVYVLPAVGDFIGGGLYSSGEELEPDPTMKAAAKVSAGDYDGAITEYLKLAAANPSDAFPVVEAARLAVEKLDDPDRAVVILTAALAGADEAEEPMETDSHAGLHFRLAELQVSRLHDFDSGLDLMRTVTEKFPGTRHAANAGHKIQEWEEAKFMQKQANG